MAQTSGVIPVTFGGYFRLQLEWTSTQNAANNSSTITARLYLISLSRYSTIVSSSSKTFRITIAGNTSSTTGNLNLSGNQKKLLHTHTHTVSHNSSGNLSTTLTGFMEWGLNINGHTSDVTVSDTVTLPTISVASTVGSVSEWRAGQTMSVNINRRSTAYTHTVRLYVGSTKVAERTGVGAGVTFTFSDAEHTKIFNAVGTGTSASGRVEVDTYSGSSKIGSTASQSVVIMAAMRSTFDPNMTKQIEVGDSFTVRPVRYDYKLRHEIEMIRNGSVIGIVKMPAGEAQTTFSTGAIVDYLYDEIGTKKYIAVVLRLTTYYGTQQVRTPADITMEIYPNEEDIAPTFTGSFTVTEVSNDVGTLLGAGYFLSGESDVRVTVPSASLAQAYAGAHIASYTVSVGNRTVTVQRTAGQTTDVVATLYDVAATGETTVAVTARDSRGAEVSQSRTVTFIAYTPPRIAATAARVNRFENSTLVTFAGTISSITKTGTVLNAVTRKRYRTRQAGGTWNSWNTVSNSTSAYNVTLNLDNTKAYEIEFEMSDKVRSTTRTLSVSAGKPTMFIDSDRNSVGVGKFPEFNNSLELDGGLVGTWGRFGGMDIGTSAGSVLRESGSVLYVGKAALSEIDLLGGIHKAKGDRFEMFENRFRIQEYTSDITLSTTKTRFYFTKKIDVPEVETSQITATTTLNLKAGYSTLTLRSDGVVEFPTFKSNGRGNMVSMEAGNHGDQMFIQTKTGSADMSSAAWVPGIRITFDVPFKELPTFVNVMSTNNGGSYFVSAYNWSTTGCEVAVRRIDGKVLGATATFRVIAGGRI